MTTTRATATTSGDGTTGGKTTLVFAGLLIALLASSLDQTVFGTVRPTIGGELHGVQDMLWVTTAYILASTVMMPVYGTRGDLIEGKGLFITAIGLFMARSIIGGVANAMTLLIVGRTVEGLGGGGWMVLSQAIIADVIYHHKENNHDHQYSQRDRHRHRPDRRHCHYTRPGTSLLAAARRRRPTVGHRFR